MKSHLLLLTILLLTAYTGTAQEAGNGVAPILTNPTNCLNEKQREEIKSLLRERTNTTKFRSSQSVKFDWPLRQARNYDEKEYLAISNYVDWNEAYPNNLTDYNCGSRSYDTESGYNHKGTDVYSWPFNWHKMDHDHVEIIAAAAGIIIYKESTQSDKSCSFNSNRWNAVYIEHADGSIAWYGHLKQGSLTEKEAGETVVAGEYLGVMGSSGNSTGPHLHFEVYDADGNLIDPYAGDCNNSTSESWWNDQHDYYVTGISKLMTHSDPPSFGCYGDEKTNLKVDFDHRDQVYFATYYRDQIGGSVSTHTVYKPDGSIFEQWTTTSPQYYSGSYWYRSFNLPSAGDAGQWSFTVSYENDELTTFFYLTDDPTDDLTLSTDALIFKDYTIGDIIEGSFELTNNGDNGIIVKSIEYPDSFKGNWDGVIHANESKTIHYVFKPTDNLPLDDIISVRTSRGTHTISVVNEPPPLGVDDSDILVYPNPVTNGTLRISSEIQHLTIISLGGRVVMQKTDPEGSLDVSNFDDGIYLIKVLENGVESTRRLIIKH